MVAQKGNKYAQEWTLENALPRFEDALKYAKEDDKCLCIQDAISVTGIPYSTFDYLAVTQKVLGIIKESIKAEVIRRVNKMALDRVNPCPSSPAIWRMKQLGERDEQHINNTGITKTEITVTSRDAMDSVNELVKKFDSEK